MQYLEDLYNLKNDFLKSKHSKNLIHLKASTKKLFFFLNDIGKAQNNQLFVFLFKTIKTAFYNNNYD